MTESEAREIERELSDKFPWARQMWVKIDAMPYGTRWECSFSVLRNDGSSLGNGFSIHGFWLKKSIDEVDLRKALTAGLTRFADSDWRKEAEQG